MTPEMLAGNSPVHLSIPLTLAAHDTLTCTLSGKPGSGLVMEVTRALEIAPPIPDSIAYPDDSLFTIVDALNSSVVLYRRLYIVGFVDGVTDPVVSAFFARWNAHAVGGMELGQWYIVQMDDPGPTWAAYRARLDSLDAEPGVQFAEPVVRRVPEPRSFGVYPADGPGLARTSWAQNLSDTTWAWRAVRAPDAWGCENGTYSTALTKVALVDHRSFNISVPDFSAFPVHVKDIAGGGPWSFAPEAGERHPWHAAATASLLTAKGDNGHGIAGMLWRSDLTVYRTFPDVGATRAPTILNLATVAQLASRDSIRVLNLSVEWDTTRSGGIESVVRSLRDLLRANPRLLVVIAAANTGTDVALNDEGKEREANKVAWALLSLARSNPELRERFLIVSGSAQGHQRASEGTYYVGATDIFPPGEDVALPGLSAAQYEGNQRFVGEVTLQPGTSYSAALVSGVAAQLATMDPTLTAAEIRDYIVRGARGWRNDPATTDSVQATPIRDDVFELDAYGALRLLSNERQNIPLCGVQTRLETPAGLYATIRAFRGSGTETIYQYADGFPIGYLLPAFSVASGGRLVVANVGGFPTGPVAVESRLSSAGWTVASTQNLDPYLQKQFLTRDTLYIGTPNLSDVTSFYAIDTKLQKADGTDVLKSFRGSSLYPEATNFSFIYKASASPDGESLAAWLGHDVLIGTDIDLTADGGYRVVLLPLQLSAPTVELEVHTFSQLDGHTTSGTPFWYSGFGWRSDGGALWLSLERPTAPSDLTTFAKWTRTDTVGGWARQGVLAVAELVSDLTWTPDTTRLFSLDRADQFAAPCTLSLRSAVDPALKRLFVGGSVDSCPNLPATFLRRRSAMGILERTSAGVRIKEP